jgi:hypothetical protein
MKTNSEQPKHQPENTGVSPKPSRGLGLSVLLIFSFVYNGLLLLILTAGFFYHTILQEILQIYYKHLYISKTTSILINASATIILGLSFYGLILLWKYKKKGYYFFAPAQAVILLTLMLVLKSYDWVNIAVSLLILLLLGISSRNMD